MIFEFEEKAKICVVRKNNYDGRLSNLLNMFELAKKDFPDLLPQDVTVQKYGGNTHRRQYGIEFEMHGEVPAKYKRIHALELTL